MIVDQRGTKEFIRGITSWVPIMDLERGAQAVIDAALEPLRIRALKALCVFWIRPAPTRNLKAPVVLDVRYVAAKRTAYARLMQSPAVFEEHPAWPAFRVAYVRECAALIDEVLARVSDKLGASELPGDLGPARKAIARGLSQLARAYERPGSLKRIRRKGT